MWARYHWTCIVRMTNIHDTLSTFSTNHMCMMRKHTRLSSYHKESKFADLLDSVFRLLHIPRFLYFISKVLLMKYISFFLNPAER